MITVSEMIQVAGLNHSAVLAGEDFLTNQLCGITSFDSPDGYKWLRDKEFVLTTGYPFVANRMDAAKGLLPFIDALVEKGAPGFAIKLGRYVTSLPQEVISYATRKQIPILSFPMDKAWSDVIVPVVTHINNKQRLALDLTHSIYEQFHRHLTNCGNLEELALLLHRVIQVPVTIHLRCTGEQFDAPASYLSKEQIDEIFSKPIPKNGEQVMPRHQDRHVIRWLVSENSKEGAILLWNVCRELHPWEKVAIEQAAALISLEIQRQKTISATYQRFRNDFLDTLADGQLGARDTLRRKAEEVGWTLGDDYVAVLIDYQSQTVGDVQVWKDKLSLLDYLQANLSPLEKAILSGLDRKNRILLLLPKEAAPPYSQEWMKRLIDLLRRTKKGPFFAGVGRFYPRLDGISKSYREAALSLKAATNANGTDEAPPNQAFRLKFFSDLNLERILYSSHPEEEAGALANECLGSIMQYDRERNGQLLQTLKTFLETNANYADTAEQLFVHKNTIKYRLQLIREMTGLNPENGNDQLLFRIALSVQLLV
ncbi:PucR family transcriptional regulator [Brevibacillus sp. H7]|uniref:PucR family transcriptional regulator n=1 Tax=Brevibacillus sp. H7 TaxID=3349138 RepID=UPI003817B1CC